MKRVLTSLGLVLPIIISFIIATFTIFVNDGTVLAADNYTEYCSTYQYYDATLMKSNADYTTGRTATSSDEVLWAGTFVTVGQCENTTGDWVFYRGEMQFDTTGIPSDATIVSAKLRLWPKGNDSTTFGDTYSWDDNISVLRGSEFGSPPVVGDYKYYMQDKTVLGTWHCDSIATDNFSDITLNEQGEGAIVRGGVTKFGLISDGDLNGSSPSGDDFIQIWSSESGYAPELIIMYTVAGLSEPNFVEIITAGVYTNYRETGDQLYCVTYKIIYNDGNPSENPEDYFLLQLYGTDGTTLKAQRAVPAWGYRPMSLYLSSGSALESRKAYIIKLVHVPGTFSSDVDRQVTLETGGNSWHGEVKGTPFKLYVLGVANSIGETDGVDYTTEIDNNVVLTAAGGSIFTTGIPGLDGARPDLFSSSSQYHEWGTVGNWDPTFQNKYLNNMGTTLMTSFDNIGDYFNVSGSTVNSILWGLFVLGVAITGLSAGLSIAGMAVGLPALILGMFMGLPMVLGVVLALTLVFLLARTLWAARG